MEEQYLNDPLNLKSLIIRFTDYYDKNVPTSGLKNMLGFLKCLLDGIDLEKVNPPDKPSGRGKTDPAGKTGEKGKTDRVMLDIQKLLSGNVQPQKFSGLTQAICSGELDRPLLKNISRIVDEVSASPYAVGFWNDLALEASELFFSREEVQSLRRLLAPESAGRTAQEQTAVCRECVLLLVKHSFATLANIPDLAGARFYELSQTLDFDNPSRYRLLKVAADCGSKDAALEYGNYINRIFRTHAQVPFAPQDSGESFRYTLKALPRPSAMWNLAYQLESMQLSPAQIDELIRTTRVDEKLRGDEFRDCIGELSSVMFMTSSPVERQAYSLAYRLHFYLAYSGFPKSFNSLAKFLGGQKYQIQLMKDCPFRTREEFRDYYLRKAIEGGDIFAMQNYGRQKYKELLRKKLEGVDVMQACGDDVEYTRQLLQMAAGNGMPYSSETLGELYLRICGRPEEARRHFENALAYGENAAASHYLGQLTPPTEYEKRAALFEKAVQGGYYDAAYDYAAARYGQYASGNREGRDMTHLRKAFDILEQCIPRMSDGLRERAESYRDYLRQELVRNGEMTLAVRP